jgi:hypothetical protein
LLKDVKVQQANQGSKMIRNAQVEEAGIEAGPKPKSAKQ